MLSEQVRLHYEEHPYPHYPLLASIRQTDTYHLSLQAIWSYFNGTPPPKSAKRILIAGCGSFAPYPFSVANADCQIVALDLSSRSLKRAQLHCLLHGHTGVQFEQGDLCNPKKALGTFGMIDAFGVLHHLDNPLAGLCALEKRLAPDGVLRIMLYSRYARREEESIRRALRLLHISDIGSVKKLLHRCHDNSRLATYIATSSETKHDSGLADALLHPCVKTYLIDEVLELVKKAGLIPLRFAHHAALLDSSAEIERIRNMELKKESPGNFILYLARNMTETINKENSKIIINRCLKPLLGFLHFGSSEISPRLGMENQLISPKERIFLRSFKKEVAWKSLSEETKQKLIPYRNALFLLQYND